jgi:HEAT repeat protein
MSLRLVCFLSCVALLAPPVWAAWAAAPPVKGGKAAGFRLADDPELLVAVLAQEPRHGPNGATRAGAARALARLGKAARLALPALEAALADASPAARAAAAEALVAVAPPGAAIGPLQRALRDPDWAVRRSAALGLGRCGRRAVPALRSALADRNPLVQARAARSLGAIGPKARAAAPELGAALASPDAVVRVAAAEGLAGLGRAAGPAVPVLLKALVREKGAARERVILVLAGIGPAAAPAADLLAAALKDRDVRVRLAAARALARVGPAARVAAYPLAGLVRDRDARVRLAVVEALGQVRPITPGGLLALELAFDDRDPLVRRAATFSLVRAVPRTAAWYRFLTNLVETAAADGDRAHCVAAIDALAEYEDDALLEFSRDRKRVAAELRDLSRRTPSLHRPVERALLRAEMPRAWKVTGLIEALDDDSSVTRSRVRAALVGVCVDAVDYLCEALRRHEVTRVRREAALALGEIGMRRGATFRRLLAAWRSDPDEGVRTAARRALYLIDPVASRSVGVP